MPATAPGHRAGPAFRERGDHQPPIARRVPGAVEDDRPRTADQFTSELTAAYQRLTSAYEECDQLKRESIPIAEKIHLDIETGYRAGKFSYLDLPPLPRKKGG